MAQKITVLVGPPCSGKSTWAKNSLDNNTRIVSRDNIREMLYGSYKMNFEDEDIISEICENILHLLLMEGKSVILDNTNCNIKYFRPTAEELRRKYPDVHIECIIFKIDEDTFKQRNSERHLKTGKNIPLSVFTKMSSDMTRVIDFIENNTFATAVEYNFKGELDITSEIKSILYQNSQDDNDAFLKIHLLNVEKVITSLKSLIQNKN